jgi:hypothetical protein
MWSLVQLAATLALPLLVFAAIFWVLMYSSFRLAFRHEVMRLEREEERAKAAQARAQRRQAGARPASAAGDGRARPRPAKDRAALQARTQMAGERRAAS